MARGDVDAKGLEVLAFDDRQAARAEAPAIVGGIQFAAEACRPAISASPSGGKSRIRRSSSARSSRCRTSGTRSVGPPTRRRPRPRESHRDMSSRAGRRVPAARRALRSCERRSARGSRRRAAGVRDDHGKPDAAVNREKTERIVESDECVETAVIDEAVPQAGGAVVHRQSPRHDQRRLGHPGGRSRARVRERAGTD